MIYHILLLRITTTLSEEQIQVIFDEAKKLKAIAGVIDVTSGTQQAMYPEYEDRTAGYTHAILVRLHSKEDLAYYAHHPNHVAFRDTFVKPALNHEGEQPPVLAVDCEAGNWLQLQPEWNKNAIIAGTGVAVGCLLSAAVMFMRSKN